MLDLHDERWRNLKGGYRVDFDARPLLSKLERGEDTDVTWHGLWEELHHQGDVGEASYAAVPHLVRIHRSRGGDLWNTYAMVAIIELARLRGKNPPVPGWLDADYGRAIQELAEIGASEVLGATDPDEVRAILSVIAISKGARVHARFLIEYSEEELVDLKT